MIKFGNNVRTDLGWPLMDNWGLANQLYCITYT